MLKQKYNKLLKIEKKKVQKGIDEIIKFIKKEKYPLYGNSVIELIGEGKLNPNTLLTIIVHNKEIKNIKKFFSTFYKKYKLFFQMRYLGKNILIYSLNLVSVLNIKISNYKFEVFNQNDFSYVDPFYGLIDIYRNYLDPIHYSILLSTGNINFEGENLFIKKIIKESSNNLNLIDNKNSKLNQKVNNHLIEKYLKKNKKVMMTGYLAYDKIMGTNYFQNKPIEIISYDAFNEIEKIKKLFKFKLHMKIQKKQIYPYFKKIIHLFSDNHHLITFYEYKGYYNTNHFDDYNISNFHGIIFHLLFNKIENKKYVIEIFKKIMDDKINILHSGHFQIFQNKYVEDLLLNNIEKRV